MINTNAPNVVLAATDFSASSSAAMEWAIFLAGMHGAKLVFHHSMAPPPGAPAMPEAVVYTPELHEQYRKAADERLAALAETARSRGLEAASDLRIGAPVGTILEAIEELGAGLAVAGTRGLTGLKHLLLGSTAEHLVQKAPCPVLTVHDDFAVPDGVERVLIPTDFSDDARHALDVAAGIFHADKPSVVLVHAFQIPLEYTNFAGSYMPPDLIERAREQSNTNLAEAAKALAELGFPVETVAREGYAPQVIEELARERDVDLIAMGTHGRSGLKHAVLGSTAERVVQHAPCPVLTVRRAS